MTVARDTPHRASVSGSLPSRNSYSRSHNTPSMLGSSYNPTHRVTRRKSTTLSAATSAQAISQAINIDQSNAARKSISSRNALGFLGQASYPSPPSSLPQGDKPADDKKIKARRGSDGSVLTKKKSAAGELKCETCGKGYKHSSCLTKHLWEHTPEWQYTSKLLISKHQQVQLLEAASVLVAMNGDATTGDSKLSDSDNSSASPAASGSDSREDDISSAETTPPPHGEQSFGHNKRYSNASSLVSRSYQSEFSAPAGSSHARHWSTSSSRPITAASSLAQSYPDEDQADLAAAVGLLSCSYGTPTYGPTSLGKDVPPVPPLPARYQNSYQPSSLANAHQFHEDVDMEEESYSDDDDETSRADEADDGVFGTMEE
ncbi:hypothetical protein KCU83_g1990, partial [Aureobasidium melanogenum]